MAIARHGSGASPTIAALASQVHPVFMLPPIAASWFGAFLASGSSVTAALVHSVAIFAAVYTAHVKDGYIDFYHRQEDDDHPLTPVGCRLCLLLAGLVFGAALLALAVLVDPWAAAITLPTWVIGYLHAPHLDMHTVGATMGYPAGIGLSLLGGYYVQATTVDGLVVAFALVFVVLLAGIKVIDDEQDFTYDRTIGKPTVAVVVGRSWARRLATGLLFLAVGLVGLFVLVGVFPRGALAAGAVIGVVAALAVPGDPVRATALLIRGSYVFFAVLLIALWLEPA